MALKDKMIRPSPDQIRDPAFFDAMRTAKSRPDIGIDSLAFVYQGRLYTLDDMGNLQERGAPPRGWFSRGPEIIPGTEKLTPQEPSWERLPSTSF